MSRVFYDVKSISNSQITGPFTSKTLCRVYTAGGVGQSYSCPVLSPVYTLHSFFLSVKWLFCVTTLNSAFNIEHLTRIRSPFRISQHFFIETFSHVDVLKLTYLIPMEDQISSFCDLSIEIALSDTILCAYCASIRQTCDSLHLSTGVYFKLYPNTCVQKTAIKGLHAYFGVFLITRF